MTRDEPYRNFPEICLGLDLVSSHFPDLELGLRIILGEYHGSGKPHTVWGWRADAAQAALELYGGNPESVYGRDLTKHPGTWTRMLAPTNASATADLLWRWLGFTPPTDKYPDTDGSATQGFQLTVPQYTCAPYMARIQSIWIVYGK